MTFRTLQNDINLWLPLFYKLTVWSEPFVFLYSSWDGDHFGIVHSQPWAGRLRQVGRETVLGRLSVIIHRPSFVSEKLYYMKWITKKFLSPQALIGPKRYKKLNITSNLYTVPSGLPTTNPFIFKASNPWNKGRKWKNWRFLKGLRALC